MDLEIGNSCRPIKIELISILVLYFVITVLW